MPSRSTPTQVKPWLSLLLLGSGWLLPSCGQPQEATETPELVALVIVDTLRRDALGCYGQENAQTPVMDRLSAEGATFEQAIASSGWTLPSVASMLTGNWPTTHKALGKVSRLTPITEDLPVAAEVFKQHGYRTLGFANAAFLSPLLGLDRGFDHFDHEHAYNKSLRRADSTVSAALAKLEQHPGEPVFLLLHLFDAHLNYDPPPGFVTPFVGERTRPSLPLTMGKCQAMERRGGGVPTPADIEYMRGVYQGEVAFVDQELGRLIEGLKRLERWEETTLVLTSDHGEEFWEHGGFEHGHALYDELVRVPLLLRSPGSHGLTPQRIKRQVRTIDIMPTLFDLAGFGPAASFIGQSLAPDLRGQSPKVVPPAFSQGTLYGEEQLSWRHRGYCLILDQATEGAPGFELYDLEADPLQEHDISKQEPELTQELFRELSSFTATLIEEAEQYSTPDLRAMGPGDLEVYEDSLEKLGYTGRDSE